MRISAKWGVACLMASLAFGTVACDGEPVVPPKAVGVAEIAENKAEISIDAFELAVPDFVNGEKEAMRPREGEGQVAIVRLKITNPTDKPITYKPDHEFSSNNSVQLCTDPDPKDGSRVDIKSVRFDVAKDGIHTTNQLIANREIQPNETIYDDYLFENPAVPNNKLVVLVPGTMLGDTRINDRTKKPIVYRFYVDNPPRTVAASDPAKLNQPVTIDGLTVKVTSITKDYPKLDQRNATKPLKYPYAYPKDPVLVVGISITNNSNTPLTYEPSHTAEAAGIILELGGKPLKRIRLDSTVIGKGQVSGKIAIPPDGKPVTDVFFFEAPASSSTLDFNISGHIFGVRGMYRYTLEYKDSTPTQPDLEPYKHDSSAPAEEEAAPAEEDATEAAAEGDAAAPAEEEAAAAPAEDAAE